MKAMAMLANQCFFSLLIPFALYSCAVCMIYIYVYIYLFGWVVGRCFRSCPHHMVFHYCQILFHFRHSDTWCPSDLEPSLRLFPPHLRIERITW